MRRVVRIKALQGLYRYFNNKGVALEDIRQKVYDGLIEQPDFYNAEPLEKTGFRELLGVLLDEAFAQGVNVAELPENQKWLGLLAQKAVADWKNELEKEKERIRKAFQQDIANEIRVEVTFWRLLLDILNYTEEEERKKSESYLNKNPAQAYELKIMEHPFLKAIEEALNGKALAKVQPVLSWDIEFVARFYQNWLKELDEYIAYKEKQEVSPEEQAAIWKTLYRKLYKNPDFNEHFAESDLHWSENRILLEVRLKETYKNLVEGHTPIIQQDLEDDAEMNHFFDVLFLGSLETFEEDEQKVEKVVQNWNSDRVALVDKWIIHLSLTELRRFPHIPVKVTINEYLEIAKAYSTPNSSKFINGVIDKLASNLKQEGTLKKSARGLMDNK